MSNLNPIKWITASIRFILAIILLVLSLIAVGLYWLVWCIWWACEIIMDGLDWFVEIALKGMSKLKF